MNFTPHTWNGCMQMKVVWELFATQNWELQISDPVFLWHKLATVRQALRHTHKKKQSVNRLEKGSWIPTFVPEGCLNLALEDWLIYCVLPVFLPFLFLYIPQKRWVSFCDRDYDRYTKLASISNLMLKSGHNNTKAWIHKIGQAAFLSCIAIWQTDTVIKLATCYCGKA